MTGKVGELARGQQSLTFSDDIFKIFAYICETMDALIAGSPPLRATGMIDSRLEDKRREEGVGAAITAEFSDGGCKTTCVFFREKCAPSIFHELVPKLCQHMLAKTLIGLSITRCVK